MHSHTAKGSVVVPFSSVRSATQPVAGITVGCWDDGLGGVLGVPDGNECRFKGFKKAFVLFRN